MYPISSASDENRMLSIIIEQLPRFVVYMEHPTLSQILRNAWPRDDVRRSERSQPIPKADLFFRRLVLWWYSYLQLYKALYVLSFLIGLDSST